MGGVGWSGGENRLSNKGTPYWFVAFKYSCTLTGKKVRFQPGKSMEYSPFNIPCLGY